MTDSADDLSGQCTAPSYVVGLGASAGGLDALERFFANVSLDTDMAFVVVQHLSANTKSMMDDLLGRQTKLPIKIVEENCAVEAGCVYLSSPQKKMIIAEGNLIVTDKETTESFSLPVSHFFRSLGQDQLDRAIGIILSGTGSDGADGIAHIHTAGGLVVTQTEETASFDGMICSAQATGQVDVDLDPQEMPAVLGKYAEDPAVWREKNARGPEVDESDLGFQPVFELLRRVFSIDFSLYKPEMVKRRITRRYTLDGFENLAEYHEHLISDPEQLHSLYSDLLIGVTDFFRDPETYDEIYEKLLPVLVRRLEGDEELRVWVTATATGEEAYSLAILIDEYCRSQDLPVNCRIFATDINQAALDAASQGFFHESQVAGLSPERLGRYFSKERGGYRVIPAIRRCVVFAKHNLITDAPFTKLDLVACRNLLIYLKPDVQRRVLTRLHFALRVGSGLWLGRSEAPIGLEHELATLDASAKLFTKLRDVRLPQNFAIVPSVPVNKNKAVARPGEDVKGAELLTTYDQLLGIYMPPAMLMTESRQLLQTFGGASRFLKQAEGRVTNDVFNKLDPVLRVPPGAALRKAKREQKTVDFTDIAYPSGNGFQSMQLRVRPLEHEKTKASQYLVEFILDESRPSVPLSKSQSDLQAESSEELDALERELAFARASLNASIQELQVANEEMQSTNEELAASNEQFQGTNEQLHSVNEELYTVNAEFQRKISELTELTDDMDNLLNSTHVDTIFLDRQLRVRKFTPKVADKFNLLAQDVGRKFESFTYGLDDEDLVEELRQVLRDKEPFEREVRDRESNVYLMRILPYVSRGAVDGVVLTLVDITSLKNAQIGLAELSEIVQQSADAIVRVDRDGMIRTWNDSAEKLFGRQSDVIGDQFASLLPDTMHDELDEIIGRLSAEKGVQQLETHEIVVGDQTLHIAVSISPILDEDGVLMAGSVVARDVTAQVEAEAKIRESIDRRDQFLAMLSHELRNPLGAIVNAARLIESPEVSSSVRQQANEIVIRQSAQMSRLLDDLLDVSRITMGKIELHRETFDLGKTVAESVLVVGSSMTASEIDFQVESCNECLPIDGDPARLQQVIVNLLRNAAKYTPAHGSVKLSTRRNDDHVEITVCDTGVGIAPEMRETIFDMFVQANCSLERSQGGIGLGLTLVKAVTLMHGGSVEVFSDGIGHGSKFCMR